MRSRLILAALFLAFAAQGCGGGSSIANDLIASPYAGTYKGTFVTTNPQSGTLNVTVATDGTLTGSGHNDTLGQNDTVSGSVDLTGSTKLTFTYPTSSVSTSGAVTLASNGHLQGILTQSGGGTVTIDLVKQ